MRYIIGVVLLLLLAQVQGASAHLTINSTSKFLQESGQDKFFFGTGTTCEYAADATQQMECPNLMANNTNSMFRYFYQTDTGWYNSTLNHYYDTDMNNASTYFMGLTTDSSIFNNYSTPASATANGKLIEWKTLPYWFGLSQADEPDMWDVNITPTLTNNYIRAHSADPDHLVFVALAGVNHPPNGDGKYTIYKDIADVFMLNKYTKVSGTDNNWNGLTEYTYAFDREWERTGAYGIDLETWDKPSIGLVPSFDTSSYGNYYQNYKTDIRVLVYQVIAMGNKGVSFYPNYDQNTGATFNGFYDNQTMINYINGSLAVEIKGFNDWLILPSVAKSWGSYSAVPLHIDTVNVTFTNNTNKSVCGYTGVSCANSFIHKKINYMLKNKNSTHDYLIVINKDENATWTSINVTSLAGTGSRNATTIGLEAEGGSGDVGSVHVVTDGVFTDFFDAYASHVYEISTTSEESGITSNQYIINASGGNTTWSQFIFDNTIENKGSHNLNIGQLADDYSDNNQDLSLFGFSASDVTISGGVLNITNGSASISTHRANYSLNITNASVYYTGRITVGEYIGLIFRLNDAGKWYSNFYDINDATNTKSHYRYYNPNSIPIGLDNDTVTDIQLSTYYNFKQKACGASFSNSINGTEMDNVTNSSLPGGGYVGYTFSNSGSTGSIEVDNIRVLPLDSSCNEIVSGNFTTWWNTTNSNVTYQIVVNATTPANTNYSVLYRQNATGDYVKLNTNNKLTASNVTDPLTNDGDTSTGVGAGIYYHDYNTTNANFSNGIGISIYGYAFDFDEMNIDLYNYTSSSWDDIFTGDIYPEGWYNFTPTVHHFYPLKVKVTATGGGVYVREIQAHSTSYTGNQTIPITTKYQNTDVRIVLNGNETATPELIQLTYYSEAPPTPDYSTTWTYGIGNSTHKVFFQNNTIGSNNSCINQGDGAIGVNCLFADNFADNNYDGWFINNSGTWSANNGVINQTGSNGYLVYNLTHTNVGVFTTFKEYSILNSFMDVLRVRGNTTTNYQLSMGSSTQTRANQYYFVYPTTWNTINSSVIKQRYLLDSNYVLNKIYGTNFVTYHSNVSYASAMTTPLVIGSDSNLTSGTQVAFGGTPNASAIVSWNETRVVNLSASGAQNIQGNYSMNYTVPASQYAKNITINGTYASGTNYSLKYRQNATGNYVAVEGIKTANSTIELPTPYYQNIDIQLEMNSTTSDTLWITNISVGASTTSGESATYMPPTPISCSATQGNFWINTSCSAGTGNITDGMNKTNGTIWDNSTNFWMNNTLSPHAWDNISFYARNGSTLNTTPATLNTQISNNAPTLSNTTNQTVNEGDTVFIDIDGSDTDSDTLVFSNNRIDLFTDFSTSNGKGNWTTNYSSSGVTYLDIGVIDGYTGQTNYTMQITVNDVDTNTTPSITNVVNGSVNDTWGIVNFTINQSNALTQIKYSINSNLSSSSNTINQTTLLNRSVNITGLLNETKYYYSVFAYNYSNNSKWSNSTIQNFTTVSNVSVSPNNVSFNFSNITNSESQIYQSSQSTIIRVDVNDSDGYITGVDVGITFLGVEINHTMTGGNDTWTYSFISGVTGTYYITHFYATDNSSGTNSTTSSLSFSVVPVISGGGGGGGSPLLNLTETNQTNTTNVTLPVIKLPTQDKLMDIANSKEAILGMFIIFGVLSIVMIRGKK